MFVQHRFKLDSKAKAEIQDMSPEFGYNGFGESVFYRTYSRIKKDGGQENWADVVTRVTEGTFSIRKDWYLKNHINWDETYWQNYAFAFATTMFEMWWLPPGRGLWAMGTDFIYQRGSMALANCAYTDITDDIGDDIAWLMDCLMLGVGVGFGPIRNDDFELKTPLGKYDHIIEDSREGWWESEKALINSYIYGTPKPRMIYDKVRPAGVPIKTFGGVASGPEPLRELHQKTEEFCERYKETKSYDVIQLKGDLANTTGCCVVAGNVRRSAELWKGSIRDKIFLDLKDYEKYPYRKSFGWMSNNSVALEYDSDFELLGEIAQRVIKNGEPGYINLQNFKYGRIGKKDHILYGLDKAVGINPCQPKWAKLLTPNGIRKFEDINIGDLIWSETGWTKIINKWSTGINKVYKYTTTAGIFYGTENHQVVSECFKIQVKDALSIDIIIGNIDCVLLENKQAVIDGLVIGDGTNHHGTILINIGERDSEILDKYSEYIHGIYNKNYQYKVTTTLNQEHIPNTYLRKIPEHYLFAPQNTVCSFLKGLFSANGSIVGNRISLKASSKQLIEEVQMLLSSIGIQSYWTKNKTKVVEFENGVYQCKESYDLQISRDREKFYKNIGFIHEYKNEKLKQLIDRLKVSNKGYKQTYEIISIELISEEETFDITVDNWTHTYWTQCCNVSNCGEQQLEHREVCIIAETLPTRTPTYQHWYKGAEFATFYCDTVNLLPTHQPSTNKIIARNRRIGIGIIDFIGWKNEYGVNKVTKWMREGYNIIRKTNSRDADEAGIPHSIKVTTIKPGGCRPLLSSSLISTNNGIFTLQEILKNHNSEKQWCEFIDSEIKILQDLKSNKILQTFSNGLAQVIKIQMNYGFEVESTLNHPWFVKELYSRIGKNHHYSINDWIETRKLKQGHILDFKIGIYNNIKHTKLESINPLFYSNICHQINQPSEMNSNLAWMLGYLWGDGCMTTNYRIKWIDSNYSNLMKLTKILKEQFNIIAVIEDAFEGKNAFRVDIRSTLLYNWLIRNRILKQSMGSMETIPLCIRTSTVEDIIAFIAGLLDSDGCIHLQEKLARKKIIISTADEEFSKHIQHIGLTVGLVFGRNYCKNKSSIGKRGIYNLSLIYETLPESFKLLEKYSSKIQFSIYQELPWHHECFSKMLLGKVIKIIDVGVKPTFDIQVENNPWFYAGGIKSHNTVPKLAGRRSGIGHSNFSYMIRRMRVQQGSPIHKVFKEANIPYEKDLDSANTDVFEFPIDCNDGTKPAYEVSLWEQAMNLVLVQREWSDNAVSNTLNFRPKWPLVEEIKVRKFSGGKFEKVKTDEEILEILESYIGTVSARNLLKQNTLEYTVPERYKINFIRDSGFLEKIMIYEYDPKHEEGDIEAVLSAIAPVTKTVTLLPQTPRGVYPQMPEEGISKEEYEKRLKQIKQINWTKFSGSDGIDEKYCQGEICELSERRLP